MAQDQEYNGWTNHSTWAVNLWLSNDQGLYNQTREIVADGTESDACERLKEFVESLNPLAEDASLYSDLLNAAISDTNWVEIVRAFREE